MAFGFDLVKGFFRREKILLISVANPNKLDEHNAIT